jgi:hypothetical protein
MKKIPPYSRQGNRGCTQRVIHCHLFFRSLILCLQVIEVATYEAYMDSQNMVFKGCSQPLYLSPPPLAKEELY